MAFAVHFSNRVETLRDQLFRDMALPLADPLQPDYVLVDNRVLGEWVNMQLAQARGIAANIRYTQPHELFWMLARAVVSQEIPRQTPLSKTEMLWKLYGLLGDKKLMQRAVMQPVRHYLEGSNQALKRYQLAASIADLFDQYLVYRPDWMLAWEQPEKRDSAGSAHAWQAVLWRCLTESGANKGHHHRAAIEQALVTALQTSDSSTMCQALPMQRLFVFGISAMPENLVQLLAGLGQHIDVTAYIINPCREYWSQILAARTLAKQTSTESYIDDEYYEIGNPLLASQGVQVRDFIALLQNMDVIEHEHYAQNPAPATLLESIQQEILDLTYKGEVARCQYVTEGARSSIPSADQNAPGCIPSVHIHNCHSRMREIEVLHDQLRHIMQQNPDILPRDIVVMMPHVAPYTPYIHAVFNSVAEQQRLPYHITDRAVVDESPLLRGVESLLQLPDSRLPLSAVLALLELPAVRRRFGIDALAYATIKHWLEESGVRWGVNAEHRASLGLPAYAEGSWQFGMDRMLAGYAMHVAQEEASSAIFTAESGLAVLPYNDIEGSAAAYLDAFLAYWAALQKWRKLLTADATAGSWAVKLRNLLDDFFQPDDDDEYLALKVIYTGVSELGSAEESGWYSGVLPLGVIQAIIKPMMQQPSVTQHHWREGVKFCSLMPMRGVPFKVVYMLGMNLEDYPRRIERRSFDLMRNHYRAGDRASRIDDRWLFLEALLSARRYLHISYIGRDMHRNETCEPSVVLSELIDYCRHGYDITVDQLVTQHPLQAFGRDYFVQHKTGLSPQLVSFNQEAWQIAAAKSQPVSFTGAGDVRWCTTGHQGGGVDISVTLDEFIQFFTKPADWFFSKKHKVWLEIEDHSVNDDEALGVFDPLEQWALRNTLIQQVRNLPADVTQDNAVLDALIEQLALQQKAQGRWPLGSLAEQTEEKLRVLKPDYWWVSHGAQPYTATVVLSAGNNNVRVTGDFLLKNNGTLIVHSASKCSDAHLLGFYIRLALLSSVQVPHLGLSGGTAVFIDKKINVPLPSAEESVAPQTTLLINLLAELFIMYQQTGLPFEPGVSKKLFDLPDDAQEDDRQAVIDDAWYDDSGRSTGIAANNRQRSYYGHIDALGSAEFQSVSERLWHAVKEWLPPDNKEVAHALEQ